jgi:predicted transcriptional regulator
MPKTARDVPPPLELLCLKALWSLQEGNVKDVQQVVARSRPLAYTTIMTVLERLVRKGKLTRRKKGRAFLYAATTSEEAMRHIAVRELLDSFFDGSSEELVRFLGAPEMARAAAAEVPGASDDSRIDTVLL